MAASMNKQMPLKLDHIIARLTAAAKKSSSGKEKVVQIPLPKSLINRRFTAEPKDRSQA